MTREQIEKAADRYSFQRLCDDRIQDLELESVIGGSFMDGAQWRINSVWHNSDEEPEEWKEILVEYRFMTSDGEIEVRREVVESLDDFELVK